jgi:hypothetical protein
MGEAGIRVSWQMQPEDVQAIARVQQRAGVQQMVTFARGLKTRNGEPISFATFFLKSGWLGLAPAVDRQPSKGSHGPKPPHCGDPDCDPVTRTRETEDDRGIRSLTYCLACNPKAKGQAA